MIKQEDDGVGGDEKSNGLVVFLAMRDFGKSNPNSPQ